MHIDGQDKYIIHLIIEQFIIGLGLPGLKGFIVR